MEKRSESKFILATFGILSLQFLVISGLTGVFLFHVPLHSSGQENSWIYYTIPVLVTVVVIVLALIPKVARVRRNSCVATCFLTIQTISVGLSFAFISSINSDQKIFAIINTILLTVLTIAIVFGCGLRFHVARASTLVALVFSIVFGISFAIFPLDQMVNLLYYVIGGCFYLFYLILDTLFILRDTHLYGVQEHKNEYAFAASNLFVLDIFLLPVNCYRAF